MGAIADLWKSERGLVAVTVLCVTGMLTVEQWLDYTKWIFVTYAAAKTVTGSVELVTKAPAAPNPTDSAMSVLAEVARSFVERPSPAPQPPVPWPQTAYTPPPYTPPPPPPISIVPPEPPGAA